MDKCGEHPFILSDLTHATYVVRQPSKALGTMDFNGPLYNTTLGLADLPQPAPFDLQDVTFRVFPLLVADPTRLETLCNVWLNQEGTTEQDGECQTYASPSEFVHFRPYGKLVLVMVAFYPKMKLTNGDHVQRSGSPSECGWWRQKEVSFVIPVVAERRQHGKVRDATLSLCTRHIFVDDPVSLGTGREVFGWPKRLSILREGVDPWFEWKGPRVPRQLMTLHTQVFSRGNGAADIGRSTPDGPLWQRQMFMEIWRHPTHLLRTAMAVLKLVPHLPRKKLTRRFAKIALSKWFGLPCSLEINAVNLKQFRDAVNPGDACYQAIVNSPFKLTVDDCALLFGDFKIHIRSHDSQPVVRDLGLEATRCKEHANCSVVEPLAPFWLKANMHYDTGETICWRAEYTAWENGASAVGTARAESAEANAALKNGRRPRFTINSASPVPQMGSLRLSRGSIRLFALHVTDRKKLTQFCSDLLNVADDNLPEEDWVRFRPIGSDVMLTVAHFPDVRPEQVTSSERAAVGWSHSEMVFWVPVLWEERVHERWVAKHIAVINPYSFVDHSIALGTVRETLGWPRTLGHLRRGADPLLEWMWPDAPRRLMSLETRVFPAPGSEHQSRVLIEIVRERGAERGLDQKVDGLMAWINLLGARHERHEQHEQHEEHVPWADVAQLALKNPGVIKCVNLKQFRDAQEPKRACYQAVVSSDIKFSNVRTTSLGDDFLIKIHQYDDYPIVDHLGLAVDRCETSKPGNASSADDVRDASVITRDVIKPVRFPLWVEADVVYDRSEKLYWRAGNRPWERGRFGQQSTTPSQ